MNGWDLTGRVVTSRDVTVRNETGRDVSRLAKSQPVTTGQKMTARDVTGRDCDKVVSDWSGLEMYSADLW